MRNLGRPSRSDFVQRRKSKRLDFLRHSHVSLLINMGFTPQLIAERIGDTVQMVNSVYGHLYPNKHEEVADKLNQLIVPK